MKYLKKPKKENTKINDQNIENILANHGLKFQQISFMEFLKLTISLREQLKFEFTKNLSEAIELIAQVGESLGFTRSEVANLEIMDMLSLKNLNIKQLKHKFGKIIVSNSNKKRINSLLLHPPIISNVDDFEIITHYISKPNYITNKSVTSETLSLSHLEQIPEIQNKIVLVEHADPGFDWIFTKQPSGLVTKYGGVASHMAIRCAEIKLPAAIGCGEALYEKLVTSQRIMLDCKNEQIIILEHKKLDEYEDQKRVLKSLGYIK